MESLLCLEIHPPQIVKITLKDGKKEVFREITNGTPDGLWINRVNQKIYWTIMGNMDTPPEGYFGKDGSIESCDLDGSNHIVLVGHGSITTPKQITGDEETGRLYWCDREGMSVMTSENDGSRLRALLQYEKDTSSAVEVEQHCVGIALDPSRKYVYWTQKGPTKGGKGKIFRMKLGVDFPEKEAAVELLIAHLPEPIDLEFGHITGTLYWTDRGAPPYGNSLNSAVLSKEGRIEEHKVIAAGFKEAIGIAVDEEKKVAYVSDLGGYIREINLVDGAETVVLKQGPTTGIALL